MSVASSENLDSQSSPETLLELGVKGSRKASNYLVGTMVSIGGIGFILASLSSYKGKDFLPLGHPSTMIFVPQGLIIGLYGIAAFCIGEGSLYPFPSIVFKSSLLNPKLSKPLGERESLPKRSF